MFYISENIEFGGHEIASVSLAKFFIEKKNISVQFCVNKRNLKFQKYLRKNNLEYCTNKSTVLNPLLNLFNPFYHFHIYYILKQRLDDIILVSGNMDFNLTALVYSKFLNKKSFIYLPFIPKYSVISRNKFLGYLRDLLHLFFYNLSTRFILINENDISILMKKNKKAQDILIFENIINSSKIMWNELPKSFDTYRIALPGRLVKRQKNQQMAIKIFKKLISKNKNLRINFFGTGPDLFTLKVLVNNESLTEFVKFEGHVENLPEYIINNFHLVLFTTRYEGVPLTLLELINSGIPIVGSNIPIHNFYLQASDIFNDSDEAVKIIEQYINGTKKFQQRRLNNTSLKIEQNEYNLNLIEKNGHCFR